MTPHNKGQAKNLSYIERMLRAGRTPESLGAVEIGRGVCKAAYRIGNMVIKESAQGRFKGDAQKLPPKCIRQYQARTYKAGAYIIQEYAEPLSNMKHIPDNIIQEYRDIQKHGLDTHRANCGVTASGKFVIFDW